MGNYDAETMAAMYGRMTEKTLQGLVHQALSAAGWLVYHTFDSRRSDPGFPDLVAVRGDKIIYAELKTQTGRLSPAQMVWLDTLSKAGQTVFVWRPYDWGKGDILLEVA